jgi:hypothetical protein
VANAGGETNLVTLEAHTGSSAVAQAATGEFIADLL